MLCVMIKKQVKLLFYKKKNQSNPYKVTNTLRKIRQEMNHIIVQAQDN